MKNKKLIIILIICSILLTLGGVGYYLLNKPKDNKEDEVSDYIKHANDPSYYTDGKIGVGMIINY